MTTDDTTGTPSGALLEIVWTDSVTGRNGYLVIDRLIRGVSSGGLRMRPGCGLAEVRGLAAGMTRKEALHYDPEARYIPLGGAKGGIDCDPRSAEAPGVLVRYLQAMRPYIAHMWTMGEDLGLTQDQVDAAAAEAGLVSTVQAVYPLLDDEAAARTRLADAFDVVVDGVGLPELAGGCGVAESVLTVLDRDGVPHAGTRVSVQGFGTMGAATARFLEQAGLVVVAVADIKGTVANPAGLDVEALIAGRDAHGAIDRAALRPEDSELPGDAWLEAEAEVLVPAAVSYCIDPRNQSAVRARYIVEAANMPVLPEAEALLAARGVVTLPDVVVNSGTNAWWWWVLFGDIEPTADSSFAKVRASMRALVAEMMDRADADGTLPREAAHAIVRERLPVITERFGQHR
jgi:glutamate dehydrogenase (NAD(P)+)